MKLIKSAFVILSLVSKVDAQDGAVDKHKCACEAEEFGFAINCDDTDAMTSALTNLQLFGCSADCTSADCEKNWLIVQTHHDYCLEENLPREVADRFHDYDTVCTHCAISRKSITGADPCPEYTCDNSGNDAYTAAINSGCVNDCSSQECIDQFRRLTTVHDNCEHDVLTQAAEEGFHDLEVPCAAAVCDSGVNDQLICDEHHDHDHDHEHDEDHEEEATPVAGESSAARKYGMVGFSFLLA